MHRTQFNLQYLKLYQYGDRNEQSNDHLLIATVEQFKIRAGVTRHMNIQPNTTKPSPFTIRITNGTRLRWKRFR